MRAGCVRPAVHIPVHDVRAPVCGMLPKHWHVPCARDVWDAPATYARTVCVGRAGRSRNVCAYRASGTCGTLPHCLHVPCARDVRDAPAISAHSVRGAPATSARTLRVGRVGRSHNVRLYRARGTCETLQQHLHGTCWTCGMLQQHLRLPCVRDVRDDPATSAVVCARDMRDDPATSAVVCTWEIRDDPATSVVVCMWEMRDGPATFAWQKSCIDRSEPEALIPLLAQRRIRIPLPGRSGDSIRYPHTRASGESSTTKHRLLHASGPHPIPPPDDPNGVGKRVKMLVSSLGGHYPLLDCPIDKELV
ncbi:hypothetical protein F511_12342 [Dorcoceras hygrometricum]|uniref:Uncharacterized protein n=1 Tax=Dorcoceras hygrometricum TaxID=472368 RepID=A0A2Z7BGT1_9LAMI|nr:hypothetical protein F511_12342 [Dorcoceras hygrometricum]